MPRYIDEEKVKHTVNEFIDRTGSDVFTREQIFDFLYETDSADVQEVRHGKWEKGKCGNYFVCSECGEISDFFKYPYCHGCGAKMEEEDND